MRPSLATHTYTLLHKKCRSSLFTWFQQNDIKESCDKCHISVLTLSVFPQVLICVNGDKTEKSVKMKSNLNPLSANPTKWSNTLKTIRR